MFDSKVLSRRWRRSDVSPAQSRALYVQHGLCKSVSLRVGIVFLPVVFLMHNLNLGQTSRLDENLGRARRRRSRRVAEEVYEGVGGQTLVNMGGEQI